MSLITTIVIGHVNGVWVIAIQPLISVHGGNIWGSRGLQSICNWIPDAKSVS